MQLESIHQKTASTGKAFNAIFYAVVSIAGEASNHNRGGVVTAFKTVVSPAATTWMCTTIELSRSTKRGILMKLELALTPVELNTKEEPLQG